MKKCPDQEAVVYVDRDFRLTYREFGELVDDLAMGLMALGIKKGEKVAVWATNVPYWVALQFATAKIGAILLTVNTFYRNTELEYLLKQSECENLVIIDGFREIDYLQTVYDLIPELKTQERGYLKSDKFPDLKRVFFLGQEKHRGMYSMAEVINLSAVTTEEDTRSVRLPLILMMWSTCSTPQEPPVPQRRTTDPLQHSQQRVLIGENQGSSPVTASVCLYPCFTVSVAYSACWQL